ncbi:50S ribosomal protein L9 [Enterobacteriaceae endosymbiont of Donacia cincticornis]|uniref:50S ribosomal protein L9 n=1 Tax=Enterobacteriaceae endosymbiont of Donacia cincticornis TaxID=2675773 RepID=UPI00144A25BA|nr:50S ribosomal protein L9 [Enterobacteriaceae endosymbiont of Donacia cincticornis]QJC36211.1 50S ribosomal protein L9 [Enterobacteriaceae endosymbiont of Donacia cincticornis]
MKVILLDSIPNIGEKSQIIDVKPGYARNFLIPKNKVIIATKKNIVILKQKILEKKSKLLNILNKAKIRLKKFNFIKNKIRIIAKTGKNGKLFGSIGKNDILKEFKKIGFNIIKKEIILPKGGFKYTGKYTVIFKFHEKILTEKQISIVSDK